MTHSGPPARTARTARPGPGNRPAPAPLLLLATAFVLALLVLVPGAIGMLADSGPTSGGGGWVAW